MSLRVPINRDEAISRDCHAPACQALAGRSLAMTDTESVNELFIELLQDEKGGYFMVGVSGFEPPTSWSQTMRASRCATPRIAEYYSR